MHRRIPFFFIFVLTLTGFAARAQNPVEITGEILDNETKEPVPYVHIINSRTRTGTVSNTQGRFDINMDKGDTLLFSAIGFETYRFTLNEEMNSRKIRVEIDMDISTMELKPVKIFAYRDEESLKRAMVEMDVPIKEEDHVIKLPGFYYGPHTSYKPTFGSPISFIASKFSKEAKEQKKLEKLIQEEDYRKLIQAKYNESVVLELTGLPKDEVSDFMNFCKISDAFITKSGDYEIALAVSNCLKRYMLEKE